MTYFQDALHGQYTDYSIRDHVSKELRFLIEAYTKNRLKKIMLVHVSDDGLLYRRRASELSPKILAAMVYDFGAGSKSDLIQIEALMTQPGAPGVLFAMEKQAMRKLAEALHRNGWVRYESTHNLDQVRLQPGLSALAFLTAYYEDTEPVRKHESGIMNLELL